MVFCRHYIWSDRSDVLRSLWFLPVIYPTNPDWLWTRLDDVEAGRAKCIVCKSGTQLAAVIIETPKMPHVRKLSTIYVAPQFRRSRVAWSMVSARMSIWKDSDVENIYTTADEDCAITLYPFLRNFGFKETAQVYGKYRPDRREIVYTLKLR